MSSKTKKSENPDLLDQIKDGINDGNIAKAEKSMTIVKRNGQIVPFHRDRIFKAVEMAFRDTKKLDELTDEFRKTIESLTAAVTAQALHLGQKGVSLTVEGIQDLVEITLMKNGHHDVARDYIIYRDNHKKQRQDSPLNLSILRHDGTTRVRFNPIRIASDIENAFRSAREDARLDDLIHTVNVLTEKVVQYAIDLNKKGEDIYIHMLQDMIEHALMEERFFPEAKAYILLRAKKGEQVEPRKQKKGKKSFTVISEDGGTRKVTEHDMRKKIEFACKGLKDVDPQGLFESTLSNFYEGIKEKEVDTAHIMAARALVEKDPNYSLVTARLLLDVIYRETMEVSALDNNLDTYHKEYFPKYIRKGINYERISPKLMEFDLEKLGEALDLKRDLDFTYLGLQTLYDRYFIHNEGRRLETPQIFWMRVAMGLAVNETDKTERAIEFYNNLSQFYALSSTPTLFNAGTMHSQLSSCYLSTTMDDLEGIFKIIADDAQLSKWAGGLGNDWTNVRATGSRIKGTNGKSQGIIPFLKVANDTAVAVNQGGKRKGAMCGYLETWHLDIEDFLELRKNTGDERRRTHDMNTANWIPDLFMQRVESNGMWTLFSPSDVPDLHDLYGKAFEEKYLAYEKMAEEGMIKLHKKLPAMDLWRKMLSMLFETGHPWITFKDPSNIRSPQDHKGVVHSSNLCTEILLNTSKEETAVCNLASINLPKHIVNGKLDEKRLAKTIKTTIRMLDNVIDVNFYPIKEAHTANMRHRPIGMGTMGFQDALYAMGYSYASHEAVQFADECQEMVSYYAILSSSELAGERGTYQSYKGSKWDRGMLPLDTLKLLEEERGAGCDFDYSSKMDWEKVRKTIKKHGMRNSNTMAIAPTATIANIAGVVASVEPTYKNLYVKSNLSGEFTVPNPQLIEKLKEHNLWDDDMLDDLKYYDGSLLEIERIPHEIKQLFLTCFEIDPEWVIECGARRQKWIDMGQSLNLYLAEPSGKKLHNMYMTAWKKGLKTTYYLRSLGATQIEKSTTDVNKRGLQPRWMKSESASSRVKVNRAVPPKMTVVPEEGCESCQ
ncbi:MAG: ribonucleoside-diphosphate reductase subunit alpha [Simkaniaceae bacterium]|nr:ribonucleoside-diphosphate reductase subunit alpha [Simkaniaceae bacterium]